MADGMWMTKAELAALRRISSGSANRLQAQAVVPGLTVVPAQPRGDSLALEELAA
jgi:hypothetical protein